MHPLTNTPPRCVQSIPPRCGIIYINIERERECVEQIVGMEKIGGTWRDRNGRKFFRALRSKPRSEERLCADRASLNDLASCVKLDGSECHRDEFSCVFHEFSTRLLSIRTVFGVVFSGPKWCKTPSKG